ncbi:hypothetical protein [Paractinoplanes maris]|uniref:hypothetical protein n=1 Tax=Paractinoplanes maris TaxID=1734446 RepID=UPI00201FB7A5|nr:hypothetical protein [Actinoplanes maris]
MSRLPVRRAERRLALYRGRLAAANTEKSMLNAAVGWVMGEYHAAKPETRTRWKQRLIDLAREMNEEARK